MANPYTSQSASNYNANPPSDDGSHTAGNAVTWAAIKTKLADVLLNFGNAINTAVLAAFNVLFFNAVAPQSANYNVAAGDRGKLINASNGATVTLLTAASAQAGFAVTVKNTGTTAASVAPNGTDQIDLKNASITLNPGDALTFVSDGSAWWTGTGLNFVRWGVAGGTADALTLTSKPPIQGLADGQLLAFRAAAANATTTPTLSPDGLGPYTITKFGGLALAAGDIAGNLAEHVCRYRASNTQLELLNPALNPTVSIWSTGDVKMTLKTAADTGWVMMNDGTIGDASSGGTTRANADTSALFTLLWNNTANAQCPVSSGRGASAAADFAAHKTIALPLVLGRALASAGAGAGLTSRVLAFTTGAETHSITTAEMPSHSHNITATLSASGTGGTALISPLGNGANAAGNTELAGSGTAMSLMQPSSFLNVMIKL